MLTQFVVFSEIYLKSIIDHLGNREAEEKNVRTVYS